MAKVEVLTLNETMDVFREYGVPMGYEKLTALIDSGAVSFFAVSARAGGKSGAGEVQRLIFKKPLVAWLEGMAGPC